MRLSVLFVAGVLAAVPSASLGAQLRAGRPPRPVQNNPRLLVANPHTFVAQDSAAAVRVGSGLRDRLERVAERWYTGISRSQMNEALAQYAYPVDAVLPPLVARQLAQSLSARAMVISIMNRREGGRLQVESRLTTGNDPAGHSVSVTQLPNQSFEEFGARVGDSLSGAFRALPDARQCEQLRGTDPTKALEAAVRALRLQPNHGLAAYCVGQIHIARKAPVDTIIRYLRNATVGDRLSLEVWTALGVQYQAKGDTAATIETFKEMLRVAPTNQALRETIFKALLGYGQPDVAEEVAAEGLKIDSANADLWDLKSNACLFAEKYPCAVDALEQVYQLDTTKADTTFFTKISYAAAGQPDTTRLLKWTKLGHEKYPQNGAILGFLVRAYGLTDQVDSVVGTTVRLMSVDSSDVGPVVRAVKALVDAKRAKDALPLASYVERFGTADDKQNLSVILSQGALPLVQPPNQDLPTVAEMGRVAARLVAPNTQASRLANYALGLGTFFQIPPLDGPAEKTKSCELARKMRALLDETMPAFEGAKGLSAEVDQRVSLWLQNAGQQSTRVNSMIKAYCK